MKDVNNPKDTEYLSLAEYIWGIHRKTGLNMTEADELKAIAFNIPKRKTRVKKNIQTPLLTYPQWNEIWDKYYKS